LFCLKNIQRLAAFSNKYPLQRDIFCMCEALLLFGWLGFGWSEVGLRLVWFGLVLFCSALQLLLSYRVTTFHFYASHKCSYLVIKYSVSFHSTAPRIVSLYSLLVALKCSYWLSIYCSCSRYVVTLHARALAVSTLCLLAVAHHTRILYRCAHICSYVCLVLVMSMSRHYSCYALMFQDWHVLVQDWCVGPKGPNDVPMMDLKVHMCGPFLWALLKK
jgi:hypothetical protein